MKSNIKSNSQSNSQLIVGTNRLWTPTIHYGLTKDPFEYIIQMIDKGKSVNVTSGKSPYCIHLPDYIKTKYKVVHLRYIIKHYNIKIRSNIWFYCPKLDIYFLVINIGNSQYIDIKNDITVYEHNLKTNINAKKTQNQLFKLLYALNILIKKHAFKCA